MGVVENERPPPRLTPTPGAPIIGFVAGVARVPAATAPGVLFMEGSVVQTRDEIRLTTLAGAAG